MPRDRESVRRDGLSTCAAPQLPTAPFPILVGSDSGPLIGTANIRASRRLYKTFGQYVGIAAFEKIGKISSRSASQGARDAAGSATAREGIAWVCSTCFAASRRSAISAGARATSSTRNAAFLMQKGIYEYSRARAGHYAKVLFREPGFHAAVESALARLSARPRDGRRDGRRRAASRQCRRSGTRGSHALRELVLDVFDRYPVPAALGEQVWREMRARADAAARTHRAASAEARHRHPRAMAQTYFDLMPIHEKLRGRDFPTTHNYLRVTIVQYPRRIRKASDMPAVAALDSAECLPRFDAPLYASTDGLCCGELPAMLQCGKCRASGPQPWSRLAS